MGLVGTKTSAMASTENTPGCANLAIKFVTERKGQTGEAGPSDPLVLHGIVDLCLDPKSADDLVFINIHIYARFYRDGPIIGIAGETRRFRRKHSCRFRIRSNITEVQLRGFVQRCWSPAFNWELFQRSQTICETGAVSCHVFPPFRPYQICIATHYLFFFLVYCSISGNGGQRRWRTNCSFQRGPAIYCPDKELLRLFHLNW